MDIFPTQCSLCKNKVSVTFGFLLVFDHDDHVVEETGVGGAERVEVAALLLVTVEESDTGELRLEDRRLRT